MDIAAWRRGRLAAWSLGPWRLGRFTLGRIRLLVMTNREQIQIFCFVLLLEQTSVVLCVCNYLYCVVALLVYCIHEKRVTKRTIIKRGYL